MKNTNLKLLVLALVGLFLTNCQRDDAPEVLPQEEPVPAVDPQAVVSLDEAKSLFEASENQKRMTNSVSRRKYPFIELETDWRYFEQMKDLEEMPYAKVPVRISRTEVNGEVLFLKKDGKTKQYLFLTQIDSIMTDRRIINADFYLLDTKGVFLSAYRMTDGVITHKIVPKRKGSYRFIDNNESSTTAQKPICRSCPSIIAPLPPFMDDEGDGDNPKERGEGEGGGYNYFVLEPVTVYGRFPRKSRYNSDFPHYTYYDYSPYNYGDFYDDRDREDRRISLQELRERRRAIGGGGSSSNIGSGMAKEEEKKEEKKQDKREDTIKDSLTNRCAKALLAQAPNLNNDIAKILRETFGTNDRFNITVHNKSFATDPKHKKDVAYTETIGRVDSYNKDILICDIYLNDDIISKASQEYILGTIYHEVVHAFLNTESLSLGKESFNKKYPFVKEQYLSIGGEQVRRYVFLDSHERFAPFIDNLARGILSLPNTKVSMEEAIALAKAGVVENKSLSSTEIYLDGEFKSGRKGITCTP
ncbi:hypothetical protein [Capnocytophaga sputigena]|uniref:hypothetical protein n=1 Tax=Capnocytophaga sputigena TaxID=1019 RepID=UPI0028E4891F|nr:hypothetical protein [Capnocytophaga sputigena]